MQAQIQPMLEIIPFDDKFAVKAQIGIQRESQKLFVMKTFMMFVLEIRSSMDELAINTLKNFILSTCQQLLQRRGGMDNIGFVINNKYYTIRNPNYEGIKDLLNAHVYVGDTKDIRQTLICLRNSIHLQAKKMQEAKISICMFTSNVAQNNFNPIKRTYRLKLNQHIFNYEKQLQRLSNTIKSYTNDCYFYTIGYVKKYGNDKIEKQNGQFGWIGCGQYDQQAIDVSLLYRISSICKRKQFSFNICDSYNKLADSFSEISALILYEFHQFSLMVPIKDTKMTTYQQRKIKNYVAQFIPLQKMQQIEDINDQQLQEYFKQNKQKGDKQQKQQQQQQQDQNNSDSGSQSDYQPEIQRKNNGKYVKLDLTNTDQTKFITNGFTYFSKNQLDLQQLHERGYHIFKQIDKKKQISFPVNNKIKKKLAYTYVPEYICKNVNYHQPNCMELIRCQSEYYREELADIMLKVRQDILSYKKRFIGTYRKTKVYEPYLQVNEALQHKLKDRFYKISEIVKQMYKKVFTDQLIKIQKQKRNMFQHYQSIKTIIDAANQVFLNINKKQIKNEDLAKLAAAINYDKIKSSLKRKLIKRVNANPKLIDDVYEKVQQICSKEIVNFVDLQTKYKQQKSEAGNCMYTYKNFATSLRDRDCIGLIFQIQRPQSAIADPGRIRIRQVSTLVTTISKFFEVHQFLIQTDYQRSINNAINNLTDTVKKTKENPMYQYCPICQQLCHYDIFNKVINYFQKVQNVGDLDYQELLKERKQNNFGILKDDYKQSWDYWNRVQSKQTFFGIMPLYICQQNWKVAKHLMKLCMGWTACGQPLGYTYSQTQTIPFMVQSSLIRAIQQQTYKIKQLQEKSIKQILQKDRNNLLYQANKIKHKRLRHQQLLKQTQQTCKAIMRDMSAPNIEQPLDKQTIQKYLKYEKPICRTVDVITNNSSFISQIYTVIKLGRMQKPSEQKFHEFFKRLIQQQLRRQTDGWNQEQVQDKFINKLLNVKVQQMQKPQYMVFQSEYLDKFNKALQGQLILRTEFQIQRQALEMVIKQNNKFNDTQQMSIIEYKRLYENRVLWFWYIRFRLYEQKQRRSIHKWKCLDLTNSYQLFTMIIQNKKQRKNWKRREAILQGQFVDSFNYYQARQYLQHEFIKIRNKKQAQNIILLNAQKYGKASQVFAMSKDLRQAAGAILNIQLGKQIHYYYQQFFYKNIFLQEKLKMLLHGQYQGVKLFKYGWKMSKKRMNRLRQRYPYLFQKYQYMF